MTKDSFGLIDGKVTQMVLTEDEQKKYPKSALKAVELANMLTEQHLCGLELSFKNGWVVKCSNKRFAKELGVPMD